jgi:GTP cyclohydrolase I
LLDLKYQELVLQECRFKSAWWPNKDCIQEALEPLGVAVVIEAQHMYANAWNRKQNSLQLHLHSQGIWKK